MVQISIVIPICNEEENLRELTNRVNSVMTKCCKKNWELLLVDDDSSDNSLKVMQELAKKYKNIRALHRTKKGGQTGCFKMGFDNAKGRIIITMDGDLQVLPEDLPLFVDKMKKGYDVVNAIREHRKHIFSLRLLSRIYNLLMLLLFNCPVIDAASNYTAFKANLVKNLKLTDNDHRYIIPIVVKRGAKTIGEVVIQHKDRKEGKSKYKGLTKFIQGGPEIILAWLRVKSGRYNTK